MKKPIKTAFCGDQLILEGTPISLMLDLKKFVHTSMIIAPTTDNASTSRRRTQRDLLLPMIAGNSYLQL